MSAEPTADDCRAALEAAGWGTTFRITFHPRGRDWVARAAKDGLAVEGQGASSVEAWRAVHEQVFEVGPALAPTLGGGGGTATPRRRAPRGGGPPEKP